MGILSVYQDSAPEQPLKVLTHVDNIAATLAEVGVGFERWEANAPIGPNPTPEEVIAAYAAQIERLKGERGDVAVDVISVTRSHPQKVELSAELLEEHHRAEDEVRFFVVGRGLFTLHIGDKVFAVLCEKNDLISIPAGTRHWFDMGEQPHFIAIRLFKRPEGCVAEFTGEDIAGRFPRLDDWN